MVLWMMPCGMVIAAMPMSAPLPPLRAPATMAPMPSSMATSDSVEALAICSRMRARWPPAMWPLSCASTPITSFGVLACISAPELMKMRWPSATKALNERSLMMITWTFCWARPAALRIGWVYSRSSCSISASRMIGGPPRPCCAAAGMPAAATAAATSTAKPRAAGFHRGALIGLRLPVMSARFAPPGGVPVARVPDRAT